MVSVSGKVGPRTTPPLGFVTRAEPLPMQALWGAGAVSLILKDSFVMVKGKSRVRIGQAKDYI